MKKVRRGFTLIEVTLSLAITGALLAAVTIGVQNSIYQQRFNDSVQDFTEFLRGVYSGVTNVQSATDGRSNQAIYGKLITFGERVDASNNAINTAGKKNVAFVYDVVGDLGGDIGTGNVLSALEQLHANVLVKEGDKVSPAGMAVSYTPKWSAEIQNTANTNMLEASILIVRHPRSGTVYTYVMNGTAIQVNSSRYNLPGNWTKLLTQYFSDTGAHFSTSGINFCISPFENKSRSNRSNVRINAGARSSSAIDVIYDSGDNACTK